MTLTVDDVNGVSPASTNLYAKYSKPEAAQSVSIFTDKAVADEKAEGKEKKKSSKGGMLLLGAVALGLGALAWKSGKLSSAWNAIKGFFSKGGEKIAANKAYVNGVEAEILPKDFVYTGRGFRN